jgi:hypothetical protein
MLFTFYLLQMFDVFLDSWPAFALDLPLSVICVEVVQVLLECVSATHAIDILKRFAKTKLNNELSYLKKETQILKSWNKWYRVGTKYKFIIVP